LLVRPGEEFRASEIEGTVAKYLSEGEKDGVNGAQRGGRKS